MRLWQGKRTAAVALCVLLLTGAFIVAQEASKIGKPALSTWSGPLEAREEKIPVVTVNSRRIKLNYEIREVGPSGVSSVELWATRDGKTWQRYSNEPPPPGPLVVHVAEEGRYGFTLVVKNGIGLCGRAPTPGDPPQVWVDVDETQPVVRLVDVVVAHGAGAGELAIEWTASDAHLLHRPISIFMSPNGEGPWTPIATGLENTGNYVWKMPVDVPYKFHVRVEAADRAGNVGSAQTIKPVAVDHTLPRGVILGVDSDKKDLPEERH